MCASAFSFLTFSLHLLANQQSTLAFDAISASALLGIDVFNHQSPWVVVVVGGGVCVVVVHGLQTSIHQQPFIQIFLQPF